MWVLLLVMLTDGGAGATKFVERKFYTEQQCITAQHKAETATVFGYCTYKEPKP
jgi:hypothetical protein